MSTIYMSRCSFSSGVKNLRHITGQMYLYVTKRPATLTAMDKGSLSGTNNIIAPTIKLHAINATNILLKYVPKLSNMIISIPIACEVLSLYQ